MKSITHVVGTSITPLQAHLLLIILRDEIVSISGLKTMGFNQRTLRYVFSKWKKLGIIVPMHGGLVRLKESISLQFLSSERLLKSLYYLAMKNRNHELLIPLEEVLRLREKRNSNLL